MSVLQLAARKIIPQFFDRTFSEAEVPGEATLMRLLKALQSLFLLSPFLFSQTSPLHGIDVTDLDRKVDPCNDFYEFANGSWRANHCGPQKFHLGSQDDGNAEFEFFSFFPGWLPQSWCKTARSHSFGQNRFSTDLGCAILNHVSSGPLSFALARLLRPSRW